LRVTVVWLRHLIAIHYFAILFNFFQCKSE
jgi:hypothetical protein